MSARPRLRENRLRTNLLARPKRSPGRSLSAVTAHENSRGARRGHDGYPESRERFEQICSKFHSLRISAARYFCVPEGGAGPDFGWFGGVCERLQVS